MRYGNKFKVNKWNFIKKGLKIGIVDKADFDFCILTKKEYYTNDNGEKESCFEDIYLKLKTKTFEYDFWFGVNLEKDQNGYFNKVFNDLVVFCTNEGDNNSEYRLDPNEMFGFESLVWEKVFINDFQEDENSRKVYPKWNPYELKIYFDDDPSKLHEWEEVKITFKLYSFNVIIDVISEVFKEQNVLLPAIVNDNIKKTGECKFSYIRITVLDSRNNESKVYTKDSSFDFKQRRYYFSKIEQQEYLKENENND